MADTQNTKLIPLTQGRFAIVDAEDYDFLMQWKWFAQKGRHTFYARTRIIDKNGEKKITPMHRIVNKTPNGFFTDHINGDGLDNRRSNLRTVTPAQNSQNAKPRKGASKYKGVTWEKHASKWRAQIRVEGKLIHLGLFSHEVDAAKAYKERAALEWGEFSRTN